MCTLIYYPPCRCQTSGWQYIVHQCNYNQEWETQINTESKGSHNIEINYKGKGTKGYPNNYKGKGKNNNEIDYDKSFNNLRIIDSNENNSLIYCQSEHSVLECPLIWRDILKNLSRTPIYIFYKKIEDKEIMCSNTKKHSKKDIIRILDIIENAILSNKSVNDLYNDGIKFYRYKKEINNDCHHGDKCILWLLGGKKSCSFNHTSEPNNINIKDIISLFRLPCVNKDKCVRACVGSCTFNHTENETEIMTQNCIKINHTFGKKASSEIYELIKNNYSI